jgi:hypothetical protein
MSFVEGRLGVETDGIQIMVSKMTTLAVLERGQLSMPRGPTNGNSRLI